MESREKPQPALLSRLLVVSDDSQLVDALRGLLELQGAAFHCATSATQAVQLLPDGKFDLILLDQDLKTTEGMETFHESVSRHNLAWIGISAQASSPLKLRSFELGAWDHITKPCEPEELVARLRTALHRKGLLNELLRANHELKGARVAAEETARAKAEFLANMSHEIRTPMNGVIAMTSLLMETELDNDQRDFVETIRTSGEALLTIINDILHFSKIESGKLQLEHRPLDLRGCIEESLDLLAGKAAEKSLKLHYELDANTPEMVFGDVTRLRQVLVNLVANAIKFTAEGEVEIRIQSERLSERPLSSPQSGEVSVQGEWFELHFAVRDTGIGIRAEKLHRLFQSFTQADSSTTREYGGTGLGLAISKGLVQLMGGEMWVESMPGQGSTFRYTVPLISAPATDTQKLFVAQPQLSGLRVLIIESNPALRDLLSRYVEAWGLQSTAVPDLKVAAELFREGRAYDLLAAELGNTPGTDPRAVASELRTLARNQKVPVILFTAQGSRPDPSTGTYCVGMPVKPLIFRNVLLDATGNARPAARKEVSASKVDVALATRLPLRVLLADDNIINQKVASRLLQQMGYKADIANNGLEVLQALERKPYDVILMDVQMPRMDGFEATRQIRLRQQQSPPPAHFNQTIVIIAMTASAMHGDREKCLAAGMNTYVPKPVRPEVLQAALEEFSAQRPTSSDAAVDAEAPPAIVVSGPAAASEPPVDLARLIEFSGGPGDSFTELVDLYLKQTAEQLGQIKLALGQKAASRVASIAHSCAGASATCGMSGMLALLRQLERLATEGDLVSSGQLLPPIDAEFARIKAFLVQNTKLRSAA